ncbi:MAG: PQQ-binding-like beta-propeller repeat protein [Planctomycetota bacterium]|nr:PQQ-binding-like beta-propeller repeat protein [Planctomycetota bacterium]MDP6940141.1 PQQ-binding-like beta-propeller repeat protein [Planctomycetota bacterium]
MALGSVLACVLLCGQDPADNWTDYRGPSLDGHAADGASPPLEWSEEQNVSWKVAVPGRGWSSPIVASGRIWLTTADPAGHELSVRCHDLEGGKLLVQRVVLEVTEPEHRNALNSYASPSATVGQGLVFFSFGSEGLVCLNAETAEEQWRRTDLRCDHMEGPGSSPFYLDGRLMLHVDGGDVQYVVALDPLTGRTLWRSERDRTLLDGLPPDLRKAYATPIVIQVKGEAQLVSSGAQVTYGLDPASGRELWRVKHSGFSMSSRPMSFEGAVLLNTGFMRPELWSVQLEPSAKDGGQVEVRVNWKAARGMPTMASPVLVGGELYTVSDGGVASCLDARTGAEVWRERIGGEYSASLLYANGRVYYFDREGTSTVILPGRTFQKVAQNFLDDGCMASAAVLGGALILRTRSHLYRLQAPTPQKEGRDQRDCW